ncbi:MULTISPECIES: DsrE family protein [Thioalkalivibrio]|uniref:DsrE family protein n=1 Tax=Thioalkalivibrio TaxID=106633 RepID=UPI000365B43B|nr:MULTISPECIES: DsrE family protein [Thioalkalivibrio]OOC48514.1 peroxiredoxin [Thioalkalivibrio versutus]
MSEETADLVVIMITGPENKRRLPSAFFLAATAAASEQNVIMYFTGPATELLKTGVAENIHPMEGGKSIADFMKNAMDNGVQMMGCRQSLELNGMDESDLAYPDLPLLTPSQALPSLGSAGKVLTW